MGSCYSGARGHYSTEEPQRSSALGRLINDHRGRGLKHVLQNPNVRSL